MLISAGLVLPESPRWLIEKGQTDRARKVLTFLRGSKTPAEVIEEELQLLVQAELEQRQLHRASSWLDCFRGTNLRRTLIGTGVQSLQQGQGNGFVLSYAVTFLQSIGVKQNKLQMTVLLVFVNCMGASLAFYFVDRFGRRQSLIWGAVVLAACMYVVSGVVAAMPGDQTAMKGVLAALFVWYFVQAFTWSSW